VPHFLIDASLPRSAAQVFAARAIAATDVRDIGLTAAKDETIASYAKSNQMAIVTRDGDFGDIRNYPPHEYAGILVVDVPDHFTAPQIVAVLAAFFEASAIDDLNQKLIILEPGRVRIRMG
jgi:predicted nuclease of predicted toxin-antitoxin system